MNKYTTIFRSFHTSPIISKNLVNWKATNNPNVRGLYEFFQGGMHNPNPLPNVKDMITGRSWTASELRVKSFEDLHKLWYILLKERNLLATMFEEAKHWNKTADSEWLKRWDDRKFKTQKSMARIRHVLSERRVVYEYAIREDPKLFGLEEAPEPHKGYKEEVIPNKRRTRLGRKVLTRMRNIK